MSTRLHFADISVSYDTVSSLEEAKKQLSTILSYVESTTPESINGKEGNVTGAKVGPGDDLPMTVFNYITGYMTPQILFHITTAYDILRANGAKIGKGDYLGAFIVPHKG